MRPCRSVKATTVMAFKVDHGDHWVTGGRNPMSRLWPTLESLLEFSPSETSSSTLLARLAGYLLLPLYRTVIPWKRILRRPNRHRFANTASRAWTFYTLRLVGLYGLAAFLSVADIVKLSLVPTPPSSTIRRTPPLIFILVGCFRTSPMVSATSRHWSG